MENGKLLPMMEHTDKYVAGKKQVCGKCWEITELPEL